MKKIIIFLTLVSFIFLFRIADTQTPIASGNLSPGTFTCNYDLCILSLNYVFTQGGCGNTGVRIKSDNDQIFLGCRIVHTCDIGDNCAIRSTRIMNITKDQSAELSCCYAREGTCTFSPENCKWGWDRSNVGIRYEATYSAYDLDDVTTTTTTTTIQPNCEKIEKCRVKSIHGICLAWQIEYVCETTTTTINPECQPLGSICETNNQCCSGKCQETRLCYNKSIHGICTSWKIINVCQ
jgi:hypothetical protein